MVFETVDFYERYVVSSWGGLKHINSSWIFLGVTHQTIKLFWWFIKKIRLFISQCFDYKEKFQRTFFCVDSLITKQKQINNAEIILFPCLFNASFCWSFKYHFNKLLRVEMARTTSNLSFFNPWNSHWEFCQGRKKRLPFCTSMLHLTQAPELESMWKTFFFCNATSTYFPVKSTFVRKTSDVKNLPIQTEVIQKTLFL